MGSTDALIGSELGDFRPTALIGRGGMGAIYEADDLALRRLVALKVLLPDFAEDAQARSRFQREIDHAVAIEHPHVVPVYSAGFARPHFYIAMRLISGPDLAKVLSKGGPLEEARALRILGQVAGAIHAVHEKGLVHRDIKPHNVLLWAAGSEEEHIFLTDFGIAKALSDTRSITGLSPIGTPAYMAPEVWLGEPASPSSDQYSMACMAYELLAGRPPFGGDRASMREAHISEEPTALLDVAPTASPRVAKAIHVSLAKQPNKRHRDVRELVRAAKASEEAFRQSQALTRVLVETRKPEELVGRLGREQGLSDDTISQLTDMDRTEVVRLRRRQARRALVGRRPR